MSDCPAHRQMMNAGMLCHAGLIASHVQKLRFFNYRVYIILCRKQNFNTKLQFFYFFPSFFDFCSCIGGHFSFSAGFLFAVCCGGVSKGTDPCLRICPNPPKIKGIGAGSVTCGEARCRSPPYIIPFPGKAPTGNPSAYQYRSFPERYASSSSIGIRTCSMVSLSRTVTQ